jgi:mono/diheme cytochrome c family protein
MTCILVCVYTIAYANDKYNAERGQLLYVTNCSVCHTTQIHWREKRLVTDLSSLVEQVRRWQYMANLNWSDDEISDVAHYLEDLYYKFGSSVQGKKPDRIMHKD